jgi:LysR family transcriptional regulator, hydrogen peroxide-inducible genes activator
MSAGARRLATVGGSQADLSADLTLIGFANDALVKAKRPPTSNTSSIMEDLVPTLRQLEYLVAVADARHFRRAAAKVNATQPTLSGQLKALEDRLGVLLVDRTRAKIELTPVGEKVVEVARRMLADSVALRHIVSGDGQGDTLSGLVKLALPPTIGPYLLPKIIPALRRKYPKLKLYVREDAPHNLVVGLDQDVHDLIITPLPAGLADMEAVPLFVEPLFVGISDEDGHPTGSPFDRAQLKNAVLLALGPGHQLHDVTQQIANETGARISTEYEGTSLDTLSEMVLLGLGVAIFPALYVQNMKDRDTSMRFLPLSGPPLERTIGLAWRASSSRAPAYRELGTSMIEIITSEFGYLPKIG